MLPNVSLLSSASVSLFTDARTSFATTASTGSSNAQKILAAATGNTDDVFKAGDAIGKIIEIVSNKNQSATKSAAQVSSRDQWNMNGAQRTDLDDGGWEMTKTGTGQAVTQQQLDEQSTNSATEMAQGSGPKADLARAWLAAKSNGTLKQYDMSQMGVTSTLTKTDVFYSDGSQKSTMGTFNTVGLDKFFATYTYVGDDGMRHDKATGKYATTSQNGTDFEYYVF